MDTNCEPQESSAWKTFWVVSAAGMATACMTLFILWYFGSNAGDAKILAGSALPTGLFLLALLASLQSYKMQRAVAISAGLAGALFVGVSLLALAVGLGSSTGPGAAIFIVAAWIFGAVLSVVVLLIAAANNAGRSLRKSDPPATDDSERK
jgi:hypothetical protein